MQFRKFKLFVFIFTILCIFCFCKKEEKAAPIPSSSKSILTSKEVMCHNPGNSNTKALINLEILKEIKNLPVRKNPKQDTINMVWIQGGLFNMGADAPTGLNAKAIGNNPRDDEYPKHKTTVNGFWMDKTEITVGQYRTFVTETGWQTIAERPIDLKEIMKQLPKGTPPPAPELLEPSSLVFHYPKKNDQSQYGVSDWWRFTKGANWKEPHGPGNKNKNADNLPVVQISWYDAMAYCKWAGKNLPTEAQWEFAARGGQSDQLFPWGNEDIAQGKLKANFWQGEFPVENKMEDGFERLAPVASFAPNAYGLYDMAGNVWEWCSDWYHSEYYACKAEYSLVDNPLGPNSSFDPYQSQNAQKIMRGGSFLCNESYCSGYRVAARMKSSPDTGLEHTGFRTVMGAD